MKLVIGYDGSDGARDAIHDLRRAGLPRDAEVRVVSVADVWPPLPQSAYEPADETTSFDKAPIVVKARALAAQARAEAQAFAVEGEALVKTKFPEWKVSHAAYAGSPYLALIAPDDQTPDLVVVGSQGRSALGRFVMGSVSQSVLTHATCSVRVARPAANPAAAERPVRVVLGVDGSTHSALAVSAVASRAWPAGTEVMVVAVLDAKFWTAMASSGRSPWAWLDESKDDGRSWAERAVKQVVAELTGAGLKATPAVLEGDPKRLLVEEAEGWEADCVVVGAKGHSGLERFLLGSVSAAVAARAHCSVEVIRQP
jgi:nucleotide-binding universal stress UspA family protein